MKHPLNKKVCKGLSLTIFLVLMVSFISAVTIYSGETVELDLGQEYDYYSIVGNSSEVVLEVIPHGSNVTIIPDKYMNMDSFELIFFDIEQEVIHHYSSGGGGGGTTTIYRDKNITKIKLVNQTILKDAEVTYDGEETIEETEGENTLSIILLFLLVIMVIIILVLATLYLGEKRDNNIPNSTYSDERGYMNENE